MQETHRSNAELHLLVELQHLLLHHLRHVEEELRALGALDEPAVVQKLNHDSLVQKSHEQLQHRSQGLAASHSVSLRSQVRMKVSHFDAARWTPQTSLEGFPRRSLSPLWCPDGWKC